MVFWRTRLPYFIRMVRSSWDYYPDQRTTRSRVIFDFFVWSNPEGSAGLIWPETDPLSLSKIDFLSPLWEDTFVCCESRKRQLKTRPIECRYDERLKIKDEKSTLLGNTGFLGELETWWKTVQYVHFPGVFLVCLPWLVCLFLFFVNYESIKRKLKTKYICGCRCYERLQPNTKKFTRLAVYYESKTRSLRVAF